MPKHKPKPKPLTHAALTNLLLDPRKTNLGAVGVALVKAAKS